MKPLKGWFLPIYTKYVRKLLFHFSMRGKFSWPVLLACCTFAGQLQAAPENDYFTNRIVLTGTNLTIQGDNTGADSEPGEYIGPENSFLIEKTVWYTWTSESHGIVYLSGSATNPKFVFFLRVYLGDALTNLVPLGSVDGISYAVSPGDTFQIQVGSLYDLDFQDGGGTGPFSMNLNMILTGPTNNNFNNRIALTGTNVTITGDNIGATTEFAEYLGEGDRIIRNTVWYSWTPKSYGTVYVSGSTTNPDFMIYLGVYRGNALNNLTSVASAQDGGYAVSTGDTLYIQVGSLFETNSGSGGGTGPFTLNLVMMSRSSNHPNDTFADRLNITAPTYHFDGTIFGATAEPGEPLPANTSQTLWWRFVAPDKGCLQIIISASFALTPSLYEGSQLDALTPINGASYYHFPVQRGHEYAIQLASGYVSDAHFSMDTFYRSNTNDMFASSERLEGTNFIYQGNFTFATSETDEPPAPETNTVWASWQAPGTGLAGCHLATAYQFQYVEVFTGQSLQELQPLSGLYRNFNFLAMEGTIYYFRFCGGANDFTFTLNLEIFQPCSNDNFTDAVTMTGQWPHSAPKSVLGASLEFGEPAHGAVTPQKSLWWKWEAPVYGNLSLIPNRIFTPDVALAVYEGTALDNLILIGKGIDSLRVPVLRGKLYYIAAAVPVNAIGQIEMAGTLIADAAARVASADNLLQEPSWEGTAILSTKFWQISGMIGGYVNERGGIDGTTWPCLGGGVSISQEFPTIPGHSYLIAFACTFGGNLSSCCGDARVQVLWDQKYVGVLDIPEAESRNWHWAEFTAHASNSTSRITFTNLARALEMDAFSVVDLSTPPVIVTQPASVSTMAGGSAAFAVNAKGSFPLHYQWFFNDALLPGQTSRTLLLNPVGPSQAGTYTVVVTNGLGSVTSAPAVLVVETATNALILVQPYGDTVSVGGFFNLCVVAAGVAPLGYQWFLNSLPLPDATNRNLVFASIDLTNAGTYQVRVTDAVSMVWSLPATLKVTNSLNGGGQIQFNNKMSTLIGSNPDAPIFGIDGVTRLSGTTYVAQLYAGSSLESLRAVGTPTPFRTNLAAGFFYGTSVILPNVPPGSNTFAQVRVWETARGASYEEARATGGQFGRSAVLLVTAGGFPYPPQPLAGLHSFSLQAGLPQFSVGVIEFVERQPGGVIVWSLRGAPGFNYSIEKSQQEGGRSIWQPFVVVTNAIGTVTFTDTANSGSSVVLYRSRILD